MRPVIVELTTNQNIDVSEDSIAVLYIQLLLLIIIQRERVYTVYDLLFINHINICRYDIVIDNIAFDTLIKISMNICIHC